MEGAVERVRPKLMTVATTMIGLLPVMFGTETGTRVMKRIAAPMVGGLASSTILTLVIIPAIYLIWKQWTLRESLSGQAVNDLSVEFWKEDFRAYKKGSVRILKSAFGALKSRIGKWFG